MRLAVALLALAACASPRPSDAGPDGLDPSFHACAAEACTAGAPVHTAAELAAQIRFDGAPAVGPYLTGCLRASPDLPVAGALRLTSDDVPPPADCTTPGCRRTVKFRLIDDPPGAVCEEPESWFTFTLCGAVRLTDTTVRVRPVLQDIHPSAFGNWAPVVDVLAPCERACAPDRKSVV